MKYFTLDLLNQLQSTDKRQSNMAYEKWLQNGHEYLTAFDTYKSRFSKSFLAEYNDAYFHDYMVEKMSINRREQKYHTKFDIAVHLRRGDNLYILLHKNVSRFDVKLSTFNYHAIGDYLYGEFLEVNEKQLSHEFILFDNSTVFIVFEKLWFKKIANGKVKDINISI